MSNSTHAARSARDQVGKSGAGSRKRKSASLRRRLTVRTAARAPQPESAPTGREIDAQLLADEADGIVEHPDGFHWIAPDGKQQFGPFETRELALADRDRFSEQAPTPGGTLQEAEREIGIADWIDPQTGEPAQSQAPPYLEEERGT
jgi:hypothetical protein